MPRVSWFSSRLSPWYRENKRPLPWRSSRDPYRIWLSEVMLQQTRVDQGLAYWERFVKRWPTVSDLASASEDQVLKEWQGLGYYSRARNLYRTARQVAQEYGGQFPADHTKLLGLKGIGDYTAAAIASICFDQPHAVVDGNVYRVLARVFDIHTPIDSTAGRKAFKQLAQELLPADDPGDHNQAVMELGATVCTPKNPSCESCPLQAKCLARINGTIDVLPVKQGKAKTRDRFFNYLVIRKGEHVHFQKREGKDIWHGLFEPPLLESAKAVKKAGLQALLKQTHGPGWEVRSHSTTHKHVLSHQVLHAVFWEVVPPKSNGMPKEWKAVHRDRVHELAVPRLIERWMEEELELVRRTYSTIETLTVFSDPSARLIRRK